MWKGWRMGGAEVDSTQELSAATNHCYHFRINRLYQNFECRAVPMITSAVITRVERKRNQKHVFGDIV